MLKEKGKIIMAVLIVLLIIAAGYIAVDRYADARQKEELGIFQQGAEYGYKQAIIQVAQQAATCQQVPLIIGNQTINIAAVDCLQKG